MSTPEKPPPNDPMKIAEKLKLDSESLFSFRRLFIRRSPGIREIMVRQNEVLWSRHYCDLPCHRIVPPSKEVYAAATGPEEGVKNITLEPISPTRKNRKVKGCEPFGGWTKRHPRAYGIGTSLYDCDPVTKCTSGDPVADVYAVVAGENSCILALADGVNWGEKSRLAARCAVAGCLQYLSNHLYAANTTRDIMSTLLKAFEHAQECIIENNATMTTLCVAVVCQLEASGRWGLCVVNVGDSLAFTYKNSKGVQEVTIGSHFDNTERDMRCPGGSLGPVDGYNPDLRNLTFSFTVLDHGDIVFLTSDGVSDNFDPVIAQCRHCEIPTLRRANSLDTMLDEISKSKSKFEEDCKEGSMSRSSKSDQDILHHRTYDLPIARHKKMLDDMTEVIQEEGPEDHLSAREVCAKLLSHVCKCTAKKRSFLEQVDRDDHNLAVSNKEFRRARDKEISRHMRELPGKLDHAAVVAFEVGHFTSEPLKLVSKGQAYGQRRRSLFNDIISGLKNNSIRRASVNGLEQYEMNNGNNPDSYTELYSLFGN
ncbi:uncharacterized protein LOC144639309 isoform X2 [Oculina patagonica]